MIQIDRAEIRTEVGGVWELKYYVKEIGKVYGIKIERHSRQEEAETVSEETEGITPSYEKAQKLAQKLARGMVTPISLHDVVDDLIEDYSEYSF